MMKLELKRRLVTILVFLCLVGLLGLVVTLSGVMPIKASSGHWPITKWFLDFSKGRSVAFHSSSIKKPALDDITLIRKGAGHYETGCVQCHGSPTRPASPIALAMTATPPSLAPKIEIREPEELFYIIKHGIKFTGMPAWPAQNRDDEVWAVVAFLLELPGMDESRYRELTSRDTLVKKHDRDSLRDAGVRASTWETCARCHGHDGRGGGKGAFPKLAGQNREYLLQSLRAYANGDRHSGIMQPVAAVLTADELKQLADFYADLPVPQSTNTKQQEIDVANTSKESIERGRSIAHDGIPERKVASCRDCHGPSDFPLANRYPRLAGQYADYLVLQLELFQKEQRGGTSAAHLMKPVVEGLTQENVRDVAAYYASLSSK